MSGESKFGGGTSYNGFAWGQGSNFESEVLGLMSESKLHPNESRLHPSESKLYPSESKPHPNESKFYLSESKFYPSKSKYLWSESSCFPRESIVLPDQKSYKNRYSRRKPSDWKLTPTCSGEKVMHFGDLNRVYIELMINQFWSVEKAMSRARAADGFRLSILNSSRLNAIRWNYTYQE